MLSKAIKIIEIVKKLVKIGSNEICNIFFNTNSVSCYHMTENNHLNNIISFIFYKPPSSSVG